MLVLFELCCCCTQGRAASCARPPPAGGGAGCTCREQPAAGDFGGSFGAGKAIFAIWKLLWSRKHSRKARAVPIARQPRMRLVGAGGSGAAPSCPPVPWGAEAAPGSGKSGARCMEAPKGHRGPQHPRDVAQNSHTAGCGRGAQREPLRAERRTGITPLLSLEAIQIFSPAD